MQTIIVHSESPTAVLELVTAAKSIGAEAIAVVVASSAEAETIAKSGVKKVLRIEPVESAPAEAYASAVADAVRAEGADGVFVAASNRGRSVAAMIAQALGAPCASEARTVDASQGLTITRTIYGGKATATETTQASVAVVTFALRSNPAAATDGEAAPVEEIASNAASYGVKVTGSIPKEGDSVDVTAASTVVCVGRGMAKQEDMVLADDLAETLGGVVGCSRPVACDLEWLPRDRYIGLSGKQVRPKLFLAMGVAGQIQCVAGANDSKVIVAINKDENAPIKAYADYFVPADLYTVVPALTAAIKAL